VYVCVCVHVCVCMCVCVSICVLQLHVCMITIRQWRVYVCVHICVCACLCCSYVYMNKIRLLLPVTCVTNKVRSYEATLLVPFL